MNEQLFAAMLKDLIEKIDDGQGSHVHLANQLAAKHPEIEELPHLAMGLTNSCAALRIIIRYLMFDVEATRREKDQLIAQLGDQE